MSKEENLSQPKPSETEEPKGAADKLLLDGETSDWSTLTRDHRDCQTPSSIDHRIPTSQSCPATPRKTVQRKRKRSESSEPQFFETTRGEEVESFFRSNFKLSKVTRSRDHKRRSTSMYKHQEEESR
ncbi:uncharacterized protein LOC116198656 [Punica granatum]|uniref:Uncharacterized protein LOC116198656 n=1 Tax=Punica granatum TaxID=22663 RepID=A0A218WNC3_PUNGR|nr:uncharacterized protein LOC116198656 [Punica granatum]OWM73731.1 hypothetical protein CDL15_Pgr026835 [Punica granatum]